MAEKDIMHNVSYFLKTVIHDAHNSGNWSKELLNRAFFWADYCEKVYARAQKNLDKLNDFIYAIVVDGAVSADMCINYLKCANKMLIKAFLQNCKIQGSVIQFLIIKAQEKKFDLFQLFREISEENAVLMTIEETIKTNFIYELEAEFLIKSIQHASFSETSEQKKLFIQWLDFLKLESDDTNKMRTLLHVLLADNSNEVKYFHTFQMLILKYLLPRVAPKSVLFDANVACQLWKQPPSLLCKVAAKKFAFYKCYVDLLIDSTLLLRSSYENYAWKWKPCGDMGVITLTFANIIEHFKCLCFMKGKSSTATKALLHSLVENSKASAVWKDLVFCIGL